MKINFVHAFLAATTALMFAPQSQAGLKVRLATAGNAYPYNFTCNSPEGVCGIEIELFKAVCKLENLECTWQVQPWATKNGVLGEGGILYTLLNPSASGEYSYDAVVSSLSTNAERRELMLFTIPYYTANHIMIADGSGALAKELKYDKNGFPLDRAVQAIQGRKVKIGTLPGFLAGELNKIYKISNFFEVVETTTGDADLVQGKIDIFFAWNGIEKKIQDLVPGGKQFKVITTLNTIDPDVMNGVGVATRINKEGRQISEALNRGILKTRQGQNGGFHRSLFMSNLGVDLWACRIAPNLENDPKCPRQPK